MSVRQCKQEISSREFSEWCIFWTIEPMGGERADVLHGIQTAALVGIHVAKGKLPEATDFIPDWWSERKPKVQTREEQIAFMQAWKAASNGSTNSRQRIDPAIG